MRKFPSDKHTVNAYMVLKNLEQMGISYNEAIVALERAEDIFKENRSDFLNNTKFSIPFEAKDIMS